MGCLFFCAQKSWLIVSFCLVGLWTSARAQPETISLPHLGLNPHTITVSGLSSGAFMAVQMHVAHSSLITGAAIFAGGPFGCAYDTSGTATLTRAIQRCVNIPYFSWWPSFGTFIVPPLLSDSVNFTHSLERTQSIDPLHNLTHDRVFLFSGTHDSTVPPSVMKVLHRWYASFIPKNQIYDMFALPAGHGLPSLEGVVPCSDTNTPYLNFCDLDGVGHALSFLLDTPVPDADEDPDQESDLFSFKQTPFMSDRVGSTGLSEDGYIFIPRVCQEMSGCHLHIAFHGCAQSDAFTGLSFFTKSGYNAWAARNKAVILYPQVHASSPENSLGCWDWWGYTDQKFPTRDGLQMRSVHAMAEHLLKPPHSGTPTTPLDQ